MSATRPDPSVARLWGPAAIQALGAAATLGTGLAIAAVLGPVAQGRYGAWRSTLDLLVALLLFGLPQGLVQALNQHRGAPAPLWRGGQRYVAVLGLLAVVAWAALPPLPGLEAAGAWGAVLLATFAFSWQGLLRVFVLCRGSAAAFGWQTALPALVLAASIGVLLVLRYDDLVLAFAAAGLLVPLLALPALRRLRQQPDWHRGERPQWRRVLAGSSHAFAQTVSLALQPWACLVLLRGAGAGEAELGQFVFASHVLQAWAMPVGFVAPLLFARLSAATGERRGWSVAAALTRAVAVSTLVAVLAAVALPPLVRRLYGMEYAQAAEACLWTSLCGPALLLNRLGVSVLMGEDRFAAATVHALARLALLVGAVGGLAAVAAPGARVSAAALGLCVVEAGGVLVLLLLRRRARTAMIDTLPAAPTPTRHPDLP